jgi:hypothetical protein
VDGGGGAECAERKSNEDLILKNPLRTPRLRGDYSFTAGAKKIGSMTVRPAPWGGNESLPVTIAKSCTALLLSLFFSAAVFFAGRAAGYGADLTLVHAGYGGIAGYQLPLWVNKEAEISKKYGIELERLLIGGGFSALAAAQAAARSAWCSRRRFSHMQHLIFLTAVPL